MYTFYWAIVPPGVILAGIQRNIQRLRMMRRILINGIYTHAVPRGVTHNCTDFAFNEHSNIIPCHISTSLKAAADWASRISGITFRPHQYLDIQRTIQTQVHPFEAGFKLIGETWEELAFMVIMRSERLPNYKKNNPLPQFEEGEREAMAKPLLERAGVTDYVFRTVHMGI
ncbi:hypothetical protein Agabi119p4_10467 [Agaricus bisporus var. burnettii]|uniref:Uncharacterized protein n=1 Tax=Agaricus bisporus var. burnettii TaxID=192524 RepID=A0A8H7C2X8_AGABI|nr:hypothetical protein Agabi119p4_10467 [Agaricus bisporus var. burnettii]